MKSREYPPIFFYGEESSESMYGHTGPGTPDIKKMIAGRPYWRKPTQVRVQHKKKIIPLLWGFELLPHDKKEAIHLFFEALIEDGFEILMSRDLRTSNFEKQAPGFIKQYLINHKDFNDWPCHSERVLKGIKKEHRLTNKQVFLMDLYWLNIFTDSQLYERFKNGEQLPRVLHLDLYLNNVHMGGMDAAYEMINPLMSYSPTPTSIEMNTIADQVELIKVCVAMYFSDLTVVENYSACSFENWFSRGGCLFKEFPEMKKSFMDNMDEIKKITFSHMVFMGGYLQSDVLDLRLWNRDEWEIGKIAFDLSCQPLLASKKLPLEQLRFEYFFSYTNYFYEFVIKTNSTLVSLEIGREAMIVPRNKMDFNEDMVFPNLIRMLVNASAVVDIKLLHWILCASPNLKDITIQNVYNYELVSINVEVLKTLLMNFEENDQNIVPFNEHFTKIFETISFEGFKVRITSLEDLKERIEKYIEELPSTIKKIEDIKGKFAVVLTGLENGQFAAHTGSAAGKQLRTYDETRFFTYKPLDKSFEFRYKGIKKQKSQAMIIDKLSQYFTLTGQYVEHIPKLNDGMCYALSKLFQDISAGEFDEMTSIVSSWDGQRNTLNETIKKELDRLRKYFIDTYTANWKNALNAAFNDSDYYLGQSLRSFLLQNKKPAILCNPWHAILVQYRVDKNDWLVYDPNDESGYRVNNTVDEVLRSIQESLGPLVIVKNLNPNIKPIVPNNNEFIRKGGLLLLNRIDNLDDVLPQLQYKSCEESHFKGLFLRDNRGIPAWLSCIKNKKVTLFALDLLTHFRSAQSFAKDISGSIDAVENLSKHTFIEQLIDLRKLYPKYASLIQAIIEIVRAKQLRAYCETALTTRVLERPEHESIDGYFMRLLSMHGKKQLIEVTTNDLSYAMRMSMYAFCQRTSRPVFYADAPEDLICSSSYVVSEGKHGKIQSGPGGACYDFMQVNAKNAPLILVNASQFHAEELIRCAIMLKKGMIDGIPLVENAVVLFVMNINDPKSYRGKDFYGEFDLIEKCPFVIEQLKQHIPKLPISEKVESQETYPINLYHTQFPEVYLQGEWRIQKNELEAIEGKMVDALASRKPCEIINGHWDERLKLFFQLAVLRNYIECHGKQIELPPGFTLVTSEGYDWQSLLNDVKFDNNLSFDPRAIVVNTETKSQLYQWHHVDNESKQLHTKPGFIAANTGGELHINVTSYLSEDDWAELLENCKVNKVILHCHCAPGIAQPEVLNLRQSNPLPLSCWQFANMPKTAIIQSTDVDVTAMQISQQGDWWIFNSSELDGSDLIYHTESKFDQVATQFMFQQVARALLQAFAQKKNVVIKNPCPNVINALAEIIIKRHAENTTDLSLILISDNIDLLRFLPAYECIVLPEEKLACLQLLVPDLPADKLPAITDKDSLAELWARARHRLAFANGNDDDAWIGLSDLSSQVQLKDFDAAHSAELAKEFKEKRHRDVYSVLRRAPYVLLTGLTGAGKTTWVEKVIGNDPNINLYQGEENILSWLLDQSDKEKVLFIDEANMANLKWSMFEGLFDRPPGIIYQGQYYPLTEKHKMIGACNPLSYGGERGLPLLFKRHGNAVLFELLSQEFIYEEILKPIFAGTGLADKTLEISSHILKVYQFIAQNAKNEVLISPRELQMMALLVLSHHFYQPNQDTLVTVKEVAYSLGVDLLQSESHKNQFEFQFKPENSEKPALPLSLSDFVITPSREHVVSRFLDILALREYRYKGKGVLNDTQLYGGLGALTIEGEIGSGKNTLVRKLLLVQGYQQLPPDYAGPPVEKAFYYVSASMTAEEKEALLLKAFDEGVVAFLPKANSGPQQERLLNALRMGKTPSGQRPAKPGFFIIKTEDPADEAGKKLQSVAGARREIRESLSQYDQQEILLILEKELSPFLAAQLTDVFVIQRKIAINKQLSPLPTIKDCLRIVPALKNMANDESMVIEKIISTQLQEKSIVETGNNANKNVDFWRNKWKEDIRYEELRGVNDIEVQRVLQMLADYARVVSVQGMAFGGPLASLFKKKRRYLDAVNYVVDAYFKSVEKANKASVSEVLLLLKEKIGENEAIRDHGDLAAILQVVAENTGVSYGRLKLTLNVSSSSPSSKPAK